MARKNSKKQPIRKTGYSFTGWAVFNWGISHDRVFRTRKEAQEYCWKTMSGKSIQVTAGIFRKPNSWEEVKDHMSVVKVKCTVI